MSYTQFSKNQHRFNFSLKQNQSCAWKNPAFLKKLNNRQAAISVEQAKCAYKEQCRETVTPHTSTGHCVIQLVFPQSLKIGVEKLQTFFFFLLLVVSSESQRKCNMNLSTALISFHLSNVTSDKSTNTNEECDSTDMSGHFAAAGVTTAGLWSGYVCLCFCSAEVSIVLRGELCCWEVHSNWIVDKTSLSSALALLLMQVNNHLNGSCLCGDWKTGEKKS